MSLDISAQVRRILALQDRDGRIAWVEAGVYDPWNHAESAMGLALGGAHEAAWRALEYLAETQAGDGSWTGEMGCAAPMDNDGERLVADDLPTLIDTNFCAYPATAVWVVAASTGDWSRARAFVPMVERAAQFVIAHQRPDGAIAWRPALPGEPMEKGLRAGSASVYRALGHAAVFLARYQARTHDMHEARARLGSALRRDAGCAAPGDAGAFLNKARYAMDWYYPALSGALPRDVARLRLAAGWQRFVHARWGCRCVEDEPWTTAAETAELALACVAAGAHTAARRLVCAMTAACADPEDGALWMGYQFAQARPWPLEKPSWTAGAAIMAHAALHRRCAGATAFLAAPSEEAPQASRRSTAKEPTRSTGS